ncbi:hypothetical protein BZG36_03814 [Bifiguratus adelaidae]|uniref:Rieske domain-containing protein n=1 Tax=Bifiguratus adelaidae TaxID=1938954 RepID=A0A261XZX7_9FUNG|nr:hypothetical protein BZG36_03814 [Bifiguratus adelaidae]
MPPSALEAVAESQGRTQDNGRKRVIVVGLGMVGVAFIEKLLDRDAVAREYSILVLGEENHVAYNRVGLTEFFAHRNVKDLYLNPESWYTDMDSTRFAYRIGIKVSGIDREHKSVVCADGKSFAYDILVLATGSDAVLPPDVATQGGKGVFVYRTISDFEQMIDWAERLDEGGIITKKRAIVVGGGLLGLEAAKAVKDMERFDDVTIVHRSKWLLSQQLDEVGGSFLVEKVRETGVTVRLSTEIKKIQWDDDKRLTSVTYQDGTTEDCQMLCYAIGIRSRDAIGAAAGLTCHKRGGIIINDQMKSSDDSIYAVGECANWREQTFGLIGPGVEMTDVLTWNMTQAKLHAPRSFTEPDLGTRLKLMGVDVASFGDFFADRNGPKKLPGRHGKKAKSAPTKDDVRALTYQDPFGGIYKKLIFSADGKYLLGGILFGNVSEYTKFNALVKAGRPLDKSPSEFLVGARGDDDAQVCSCHNVSKGALVVKIRDGTCKSIGELKSCTKAGTACGGCESTVKGIFNAEMKAMGAEVSNALCIHFSMSRADLFNVIMVRKFTTFEDVMKNVSTNPMASGCEICKPTIGSILASVYNRHVMDTQVHGLQDTNDRYLGNIQRNGTFSVIPRISAGEVTPEKLIVLGEVAKEYNLYCKITGGQRIDMFGAQKQDLPAIWKKLNDGGFESGHAYGKSLRTVKSCVGTTWCRYGIGDSVGMAVRLEERYKSIRSPHKIKGAVSGYVRDCAEFHNKDFGLVAVQAGFNVFVGGNGGMKPAHAQLLQENVLPDRVIALLDRYLMFYIRTADRLQRTARWLEALPGGIEYLRDVIVHDKLGICAELEKQMQELVGSFFDEWNVAIKDAKKKSAFRQFVNTDKRIGTIETVSERGQPRPADWPAELHMKTFVARHGQMKCGSPHPRYDENGSAYISCPLHKRNYILSNGEKAGSCKDDDAQSITTFEAKEEDGQVWLKLPPGVFAPYNATAEALGSDPTSGSNPNRIVKGAFIEGYPNTTVLEGVKAASYMVEMVKKYPGQVSIYATGAMTNVALAVILDDEFARRAKELVIMGGYVDDNMYQATGTTNEADINSDINLMIDPEAAKIALTAPFPKITIAGNVANQGIASQDFQAEIYQVKNSYSKLIHDYYPTIFPFWDETAMALLIDPTLATNTSIVYMDVDTAYSSPSYGNVHVYQKALMPPNVRTVHYVNTIDAKRFKNMIKNAVQYPKTCADLKKL